MASQDQLIGGSMVIDKLDNDKEDSSGKYTRNFKVGEDTITEVKESQEKEFKNRFCSDEEYESFGETIDANDNFEDSDQFLEVVYDRIGPKKLKTSLKNNQLLPDANMGSIQSNKQNTGQEKSLSSYVHELSTKENGLNHSDNKSISSADSFSSSIFYGSEKEQKKGEKVSKVKSASSVSSSPGHGAQGKIRTEGKREAWVTKSKATDKEYRSSKTKFLRTMSAQSLYALGCTKHVQVKITRLSKNILKQHGYDSTFSSCSSSNYSTNQKASEKQLKQKESKVKNSSKTETVKTFKFSDKDNKTKVDYSIDSSVVTKEFKRKRTFSDSTEFSARIHSYSSNISSNVLESSKVKRRKRREYSSRTFSRYKSQQPITSSDSEFEEHRTSPGNDDK